MTAAACDDAEKAHQQRVKRAYIRMKLRAAANVRQVDALGRTYCAALQARWYVENKCLIFDSLQREEEFYESDMLARTQTEYIPDETCYPRRLFISKQSPLIVFMPSPIELPTTRVLRCDAGALFSVNTVSISEEWNTFTVFDAVAYVRRSHSLSRSGISKRVKTSSTLTSNESADSDASGSDADGDGHGDESQNACPRGFHATFLPNDARRGGKPRYLVVGHTWGPVQLYWRHLVSANFKAYLCIDLQTNDCQFRGTYALRDMLAKKTYDRVTLDSDGQYARDVWHIRRNLCIRNEDHRRYRTE